MAGITSGHFFRVQKEGSECNNPKLSINNYKMLRREKTTTVFRVYFKTVVPIPQLPIWQDYAVDPRCNHA
jgi:hypothetical protein